MAKGDDIQERLIQFGVKVVQLCSGLPRTEAARHLAGQLLRCGTAPAANYGEARGAESARDFVHKLGIVLKELNECSIWLRMVQESGVATISCVDPLRVECAELSKIIAVSIRTVRANNGQL
jgi:four helix bundle protein